MHPNDPRWKTASTALEMQTPDPSVVLHEHEGVVPKSYMAVQNLQAIRHAVGEIMALMNEEDELPAWCEQMLAEAKANVSKARDYIMGEKA
jgi:hypothetical protein